MENAAVGKKSTFSTPEDTLNTRRLHHSLSVPSPTEPVGATRFQLIRIVVCLIAAAVVWFRLWEPVPRFSLIGISAIFLAGWPIFGEAFENLGKHKVSMEIPLTIAICAATAMGEVFTALMVAVVVLTAELARTRLIPTLRSVPDLSGYGAGLASVTPEAVHMQRLAEKLASCLVYFTLASALVTFAISRNPHSSISVLIVAGVSGLTVGTPLAIISTIARAANDGVVIKGGAALEQLWKIDSVLINKSGILTTGKQEVRAITPAPGHDTEELLFLSASVEKYSEHSIARAIIAASQAQNVPTVEPHDVRYMPCKGISALLGSTRVDVGNRNLMDELQIDLPRMAAPAGTRVFIARDYRFVGCIDFGDVIRQEAASAVSEMHEMGLKTELVTGDTAAAASCIADSLGIPEISSGLLPRQKLDRIRELLQQGRLVAMIADGMNEAQLLAQASLGIAMDTSAEVARGHASVILMNDDLCRFPAAVKLAKRCQSIVLQTFWGTVIVDAAGIALAASGVVSPLLAAIVHVSSDLAFMLYASRLGPTPISSKM